MNDVDLLDNVAAVGMKSKDCTVSEIADKMKAKDGEKNAEVAYAGTADKLKLKNFVKSEVNLALFTGDILPREDSEENAAKDTDKIADKDSKDTKETLTVEEKTEQFEELTEKLAMLGIPVFVDRSSEEKTELGKQEWIKVYGVLYGCEELTNEKFDAAVAAAEKSARGKKFAGRLDRWKNVAGEVYIWDYIQNFDDYLTPFPVLELTARRLRFYRSLRWKQR